MRTLQALVLTGCLFVAALAQAQESGLRVEVRPQSESVINAGKVLADVKVANPGLHDESLRLMMCSFYESWVVDNPAVSVSQWNCQKNPMVDVTLKPGDVYENKLYPLELFIGVPTEELTPEGVTFRLGFKKDILKRDVTEPLIWSEPVTIKVTEQ